MATDLFDGTAPSLEGIEVSSIEYDSRRVGKGSCFVAMKGFTVDGHEYIGNAVSNGASVIVLEREPASPVGIPVVKVGDSRDELARLSDIYYGQPSSRLGVIGITGTNGKTTVSYILQKILEDAGYGVSRIGTVEYSFPDGIENAPNTTPESADLQKLFARAAKFENPRCILEASSHGLALGRLAHTIFRTAVFMNLTQDHLDFHSSMEDYENAKRILFTGFEPEYSIINIDDDAGRRLAGSGINGKIITFGFSEDADMRIAGSKTGWEGSTFTLATPDGALEITTPMPGKHNIYNTAAAVAAGIAEGIDPESAVRSAGLVAKVPGRFEKVETGKGFSVVVDYAHTDNALTNLLVTVREITRGKVICLFGCGGDRDRSKRKLMGQVADRLADVAVVTSDNPRTEEPLKIIRDILEGFSDKEGENVHVIESRREAIRKAIEIAGPGDSVVIAGKGHETYQIIGTERRDFDDRLVASDSIKGLK
jgi:UDP-N-acetylmuramoyl-L-alanyl-D-glutamate--2,6-diaminopimelate ligase